MPHYNRAILADISEKSLDPSIPHKVGDDNRLVSNEEKKEKTEKEVDEVVEASLSDAVESQPEVIEEPEKKKANRFKKKTQQS